MPVTDREKRLEEEGKLFRNSRSFQKLHCKHFKPTLEEIRSTTFSDYCRNIVLNQSRERYDEEKGDRGVVTSSKRHCVSNPKIGYDYGLGKVTLPKGFSNLKGISNDQTGRGAEWQSGTLLGNMILPSPMTQIIRGIGGIYEFTFMDNKPTTVAEFREKADKYIESQLGGKINKQDIDLLERKFWKRLGPTMESSMYGADMDGTLFSKDDNIDFDWNLSKLQSCLQLLLMDQDDNDKKSDVGGIPGVTTPYLYFGMWASVFCAHTEDMNLLSINYLHAGAPKVWYAIAAGEDSRRFEHLMEANYHHARKDCPEYLRHKRSLVSPSILKSAGIPYTRTVQYPGDAIVTFPGSYHSGFNTGFNVAEATNFAVPEWIPYGRIAHVCNCRPDSVRLDVNRLETLLLQYEKEVKQTKRLLWKDWVANVKKKRHQEKMSNATYGSSPKKKAKKSDDKITGNTLKPKDFWVEVMQSLLTKPTKKSKKSRKKKVDPKKIEVWHLAKPIGRKPLRPSDRVLCIIPAVVELNVGDDNHKLKEDGEECFAGYVVEEQDDHIRVRIDGMRKKDEIWMPKNSSKLFMDGGKWEDKETDFKMPALHYWKEEDFSKI